MNRRTFIKDTLKSLFGGFLFSNSFSQTKNYLYTNITNRELKNLNKIEDQLYQFSFFHKNYINFGKILKTLEIGGLKEEYAKNLLLSTCILIFKNKNGITHAGSGFFINENTIMTNGHVLEKKSNFELVIFDFQGNKLNFSNSFIQLDSNKDLAFIKIKNREKSKKNFFIKISKNIPKKNEKIFQIGFGFNIEKNLNFIFNFPIIGLSIGKYISIVKKKLVTKNSSNHKFFLFSNKIFKGDSGAAMINSKGNLISIATYDLSFKINSLENMMNAYVISSSGDTTKEIKEFLIENKIKFEEN